MKFEDLCRETYPKIYNYILARTKSREISEDITQEVFLIAYRKGDDFLSHENPMAFLYVSAKNLLFEHFREKAKLAPLGGMGNRRFQRRYFRTASYKSRPLHR